MAGAFDTWDTPNATWDSGLQWDVNIGPAPGDASVYTGLITSEHNKRPDFMAMVAATTQPFADAQYLMGSMSALFDLDAAVGVQLDAVGAWVGASRLVEIPIEDVYFSLDVEGLGLDQGTLLGPFDPISGLTSLPDDAYRTLIRARIANNQWDGTIPGAYDIWDTLFAGTGYGILIQDLGGMHMVYALTGPIPDALTKAMFTGGYLNIKPAGVRIEAFLTPFQQGAPYFGLDVQNASIAGLDAGYFGISTAGA